MRSLETDGFATYFAPGPESDMAEEVKGRRESEEWEAARLRPCPCCGREALPIQKSSDGTYKIACAAGCRIVEGITRYDAIRLYNEPRFTDVVPVVKE